MTSEELKKLEDDLWTAADNLRANSDLKSSEYSTPVLGVIFLKFADNKFSLVEEEIKAELEAQKNSRKQRKAEDIAIAKCGFYLPPEARYDYLLNLPEEKDIDKALKEAMQAIEKYKTELNGMLPQDEYSRLTRTDKTLPATLLKIFADIPKDASGDLFGKIYEYFLGKFALAEGQGGGEFFTPTSVVKLMVEIIEPYSGKIFDPARGSGGMFVQSSNFIDRRQKELHDTDSKDLFAFGCEKTLETVRLANMNIAVNGLRGDIRQANSYYEDPFKCYEKFDYVMANPPFNVDDVSYERVKDQERFNEFGIPKTKSKSSKKNKEKNTVPNGNYLWINLFATSINEHGRAALVMANSASDARHSEYDIRKTLIEHGLIDIMLTLPSNMFMTVTLPATLWFFDKSKRVDDDRDKENVNILFIDARNIYRQISRARREFTEEQIQNLATIVRLRRGERHRFIELIHSYYQTLNHRLHGLDDETGEKTEPSLNEQLEVSASAMQDFIKGFRHWYKQTLWSFSNEQQAKAAECEFETKLGKVDIPAIHEVQKAFRQAQTVFNMYQERIPSFFSQESEQEDVSYAVKEQPAQYNILPFAKEEPGETVIDAANTLQRDLCPSYENLIKQLKTTYKAFDKCYRQLETLYQFADKELRDKKDKLWKDIPPLKMVREMLDSLNEHMNKTNYVLSQIHWLHERFPRAKYEDVPGLCRLASLTEIKEQDYSLNPGRYVGVVIEDDGMTEEEFKEKIEKLHDEFSQLNTSASKLEELISENIKVLL